MEEGDRGPGGRAPEVLAAALWVLAGPALLAGLWLACRVTAWACVTMRAVGHL